MKKIWFMAFALLSVVACRSAQDAGTVSAITPMEVEGLLRNEFAVLVDVRERDEIKETGMAAKALWFPNSKISDQSAEWKEFVSKLPKGKEIVLYCAAGGRAGTVGEKLAKMGYKARNMGGFDDWVAAKLPVRKEP